MNSIKTLEGNDIFEVSRIFQKMYENALDDYVEVVPPNITRAAAINEKTSASFKDFTILWNKIIAYSNAYAYKYNLPGREIVDAPNSITKDDEDAASEYVIELFKDIGIHKDGKSPSISASSLAYNFETVLEEINGRINHEQTNGREIIAGVLLRETRIIANKFLTKKEKTSSGNQTFLEMTDRFNVFIEATKGISYAHKSDSKDSRVYDELNNLNNPLIDAISRLEEHFVPWNDLIMSGSIKYNHDEVSEDITLLETNVRGHETKSVLHNKIVKK